MKAVLDLTDSFGNNTYTDKGYTRTEILEALDMIRYICEQYKECENCPFANRDEVCQIHYTRPELWNVKKETERIWRAFEQKGVANVQVS